MIGDAQALEGSFRGIAELERVLCFRMVDRATAMVRLEGPQGLGLVWLREGLIVEARHGGLSGQSALYAALAIPEGSFFVQLGNVEMPAAIARGDIASLREMITQLGEWCRLRDALPPLSYRFTLDRDALHRAASELTPIDVKILKAAKQGHPTYLLGAEAGISDLVLFRRLIHLLRLRLISPAEASLPPLPATDSAPLAAAPGRVTAEPSSERPASGYSVTGSGLVEAVTVAAGSSYPASYPPNSQDPTNPRLFARSQTPPPMIPKAPAVPSNVGVAAAPKMPSIRPTAVIETTGELQPPLKPTLAEGFVSAAVFGARAAEAQPSKPPSTARQFQSETPPVTPVQFRSNQLGAFEVADAAPPSPEQGAQLAPVPVIPIGGAAGPRWVRRADRPFAKSELAPLHSPHDLLLRLPGLRIHQAFYRASIFGSLAFALGCFLLSFLWELPLLNTLGAIAFGLHLAAFIAFVAKMWGAVHGARAALSVWAVVLPLFIPLFGLVWWVRVWVGYIRVYNDVLVRTRVHAPQLSQSLAWAAVLLPGAGWVCGWILVGQICQGINVLAAAADKKQSGSAKSTG